MFAGAYFSVALVSSPSAQAPPMAEALDSDRHSPTRIRQVQIENAGDGGLVASLRMAVGLAGWRGGLGLWGKGGLLEVGTRGYTS